MHLARTRQLKQQAEASFHSSTQQLQEELARFKDMVLAYDMAARKPDPPERDRLAAILPGHFRQLTGDLHVALGPDTRLGEVAQQVFGGSGSAEAAQR